MILIKTLNNFINSNKYQTFKKRFLEESDFQSIVFLSIAFPIFFIYVFMSYEVASATNILLTGFMQGVFYALIALGFSIIFGIARMFKLSIGGYFIMGAYTAFWLRQMTVMDADGILETSVTDFNSFKNMFLILAPLILFIAGLIIIFFKFEERKYSLIIILVNILLFVVHRQLMASFYDVEGFNSTVNAAIIQVSMIYFTLALLYIELSPKQAFTAHIILNIFVFLTNSLSADYSPALYFALFFISVMFVAFISILIDRYLLDKIRSNVTNVIIVTFGIALIIQSVIPLLKFPDNGGFTLFGVISHPFKGVVSKTDGMELFGTTQQSLRVIATVIAIILIVLVISFLKYTRMGRAMQAVAQDEDAAWLVGINVRKVYLVTTGLGMGLAAAAAILTTSYENKPEWGIHMGWVPLVMAIAVVTLGGLGSIMGSVIAGLIIGFVEAFVAHNDIELSSVVPLIVILLVMLVRPDGLFGKSEEGE